VFSHNRVPHRPVSLTQPCSSHTRVPHTSVFLTHPFSSHICFPPTPIFLPHPCSSQTRVPPKLVFLPYMCSSHTRVPPTPVFLPHPCVFRGPHLQNQLELFFTTFTINIYFYENILFNFLIHFNLKQPDSHYNVDRVCMCVPSCSQRNALWPTGTTM
jgi:hypothetical protein